jgi:nuclear-control-of-ATPase protein 2
MSTFYSQQADRLLLTALPPSSSSPPKRTTERKQALHGVLVALNPPISTSSVAVHSALATLRELGEPHAASIAADGEEAALRHAIHGRIAITLFGQAFDTFLGEAIDAETEAEWWGDIERSRWNIAVYLLQSACAR